MKYNTPIRNFIGTGNTARNIRTYECKTGTSQTRAKKRNAETDLFSQEETSSLADSWPLNLTGWHAVGLNSTPSDPPLPPTYL